MAASTLSGSCFATSQTVHTAEQDVQDSSLQPQRMLCALLMGQRVIM